MEKIVYFDWAALIVFIILIVVMMLKGTFKSRYNLTFIVLLGLMIVSTVCDIVSVIGDNENWTNMEKRYFANVFYLITHNLSATFYAVYMISQSDTWHKFWANKVLRFLFFLPVVITSLFIITTRSTSNIFYFNGYGEYTRGPLFYVLYIQSAFYFIFGIIYAFKYKKAFQKGRFYSALVIYPFMITAIIIQFLKPEMIVELFANSLGMLFVCIMVQNPGDRIDKDSNLQSFAAFKEDMTRCMVVDKRQVLLAFVVTNYNIIRKILSQDLKIEFQTKIGEMLKDIVKKYEITTEIYYLEHGKFVIAMGTSDEDKVENIAADIRFAFAKKLLLNQVSVDINCVNCVIKFPGMIPDTEALLDFLEDLEKAKDEETIFAEDMKKIENYEIKKNIDEIIERAIAEETLSVYYQPIYSVKDKSFKSAEALIRLIDSKFGFVPPDLFIPAAEENGSIHRIGSFVLNQVCSFISSEDFKDLGVDYIEVNLSAVECMQDNLTERILGTLGTYDVSKDKINLEVTETATVYSQEILSDKLNSLYEAGISFSLDDFGTGYSNLIRIVTLPLKIIKIDRSIALEYNNERSRNMIENTIKMLKGMNYEIVVEGVETEDMLEYFSSLGCDYIQGYYFSKPLPRSEYEKFLKEHNVC